MSQTVNGFPIDGFRPVTILTDDLIVYQGDLEHCNVRKHDDISAVAVVGKVEVEADIRPNFLTLCLACTPALLVPTGTYVITVPLDDVYPTLGTVRINIDQIIGISDFNGLVCAASGMAPSGG
ncbi:hypothetical protein SDC9_13855 [bioreactor metagenome]|uniref:Uncharacterized protein n=1 Tax=bioreactor metagenome TaxID=1076179 RepID=A0A644TPE2_9ZZZZ